MEKLDITKHGAQAKVVGTIVAFSGAILMTVYKGNTVKSMNSQNHHNIATSKVSSGKDWIKGSVMLVVSYFPLAAFYNLHVLQIYLFIDLFIYCSLCEKLLY